MRNFWPKRKLKKPKLLSQSFSPKLKEHKRLCVRGKSKLMPFVKIKTRNEKNAMILTKLVVSNCEK